MNTGPGRRRLPLTLDWLAAVLVGAAIAIHLTGGVYLTIGDVRISARRDERALLLAVIVGAVRLLLDRRQGAFGVASAVWRRRLREHVTFNDERTLHGAPRAWRRAVLATLALCAAGAVLMREQIAGMDAVPDYGDPLLSIWRLSWVWQQLRGDPRDLFNANIFHPEPLTLTYSDSTLLPALTAAPLLTAGVSPAVAYNLVFLSGFVLSGVATYVLVERLTGSARSALVSAVLFAFSAFRFEHYSHLELQMTHWMPMTLLAVHLFVESGRARYGLMAALAWIAQLYSSMYFAVFLALYATVVAGVSAMVRGRTTRIPIAALAATVVLAAVLAFPLVRAYSAAEGFKMVREEGAVRELSATGVDYLRVHDRSALYSGRMPSSESPERALFPGAVPVALASAALVPPLSPLAMAYAAALAVAFESSLGLNGWLYPILYDWLPPVRRMRAPARFSVLVGLSLAVLAGFGTRRLLWRFEGGTWRQRATFGVIIAAALVDASPVLRLQRVWGEAPAIYSHLADKSDVVLAEFPVPTSVESYVENTPFMYFSLWHWKPMLNGYSGVTPPSFTEFVRSVGDFPAPRTIGYLRVRRVTHVTVNCALFTCGPVVSRVEQSGAFRRIAIAAWQGHSVYLYELRR